ncbi:MAG TPA: cytochrome P450 [Trebonia sp.]|nr:cytochrome P450 [Trebonia sp.]
MDAGPLYWDPYDARLAADPWPLFNRIREEAPLFYNEAHDFYAVSRYADVERTLTDTETFSSARGVILELIQANIEMPPGTLIMEDPPVHNIRRQLLARVFSPRRVADLEPKIREYCVGCLDPLVGESRFDLIEKLGLEMPMRVIGMLIGIPEEGQAAFRDESNARLATEDGGKLDFSDEVILAHDAMGDYLDWRYKHPSDDVMTELINAGFEDENGVTRTLTRDEIMMYVTVLAGAGNETTGRLIGWMGSTLARYPSQRAEIAADRSLVPGAVEEVLRFEPPGPFNARYVTRDVELYGQTVPAGSAMLALLGAANRDPRRYDRPDEFDIHRKKGMHMTFILGPHYCLGSALARLEGRVALEEIVRRWPSWEVDWDGAKLQQTSSVRGWEKLPLVVS